MNESKESLLRRCAINNTAIEIKSAERDAIAAQVAAFLARGGVIHRAGNGESAGFNPDVVYRNYLGNAIDTVTSCDHGVPFAAQFLGISQSNLHRLLLAGKGPAHVTVQKGSKAHYRFRMADLMAYREQREAAR